METNLTLAFLSPNDIHTLTNIDRSIFVAFSSENIHLGECTKSSMNRKVHQQDQCVSVRRPNIYVSQNGVTDGINYMAKESWCLPPHDCEWTSTQARSGVD